MWCKFGHVEVEISTQRNSRALPCGIRRRCRNQCLEQSHPAFHRVFESTTVWVENISGVMVGNEAPMGDRSCLGPTSDCLGLTSDCFGLIYDCLVLISDCLVLTFDCLVPTSDCLGLTSDCLETGPAVRHPCTNNPSNPQSSTPTRQPQTLHPIQ